MSKTFHYDDTLGFVRRTLRYDNTLGFAPLDDANTSNALNALDVLKVRAKMADYIKREDLLDLYDLGGLEVKNAKVPLNIVIQNIKDMPSADVVSCEEYEGLELVCKNYEEALKDAVDELEKSDHKRGEIITNEFGNESCSVCHYGLVLFITDENNILKKPNFCPNCGARIESEGEND